MKQVKILLALLTVVLYSDWLLAQEKPMSVVTKTTTDVIRLKWLPSGYDQLRTLIKEGSTIEQVELSGSNTAKNADYSTAIKTVLAPAQSRLTALNANDSVTQRMLAVLDPFIASTPLAGKESRDFAFALAILEITVSDALSDAIGCQLTVNAKNHTRYGFRITAKGLPVAYAEVNTAEPTVYPAIPDFHATLDRKKTIELTWTAKHYQPFGYAFHIEKSIDSPKSGTNLTLSPYFPVRTQSEKADKQDFLRDEKLQEGKTHYYRLVGLNYFGEPALFSEWQKIYVPRHLNAEVYIDTLYADNQTRVIAGTVYRLSNEPVNLKEYTLLRSDKQDGVFTVIQQKTTTDTTFRFSIDMPKTGDRFYYKVAAVSVDNDSVFSTASYLFTLDQEPPSKPTGLTGTINENGIVSLSWIAPNDNDLQGYRIFRANHKREDFTERNTELSSVTTFTDTLALNNLTFEVYYCVKAVDKNFNNSSFSDTILILKPDTIAPVAALLNRPLIQDSLIRLSWINSPGVDLQNNILVRYSGNSADTLLRWSDTLTTYSDEQIVPGTSYRYQIITADKAGNHSTGTPRQLYYEPGYRQAVSGFNATVMQKEKCIRLSWQPPTGEVFSYQIYRSTGEGKLLLIKTIENGTITTFEDKNITSGNTYRYTIKYMLKSGIQGLPATVLMMHY
jgi:fibronectin type 3 domain-containing protein